MLDYVSGYDGSTVKLDSGPLHVGTATDLRSREWSYTLGHRGIAGAVRPSREASLELTCTEPAALDRARRVFDRDVRSGTVGELVCAGEWRTRALVTGQSPSTVHMGFVSAKLTVVLVDGVWRRSHELHVPIQSGGDGGGLDLECDLPCDLSPVPAPATVDAGWGGGAVGLRLYGPASNPSVTIGGNLYQVLTEVPDGARVEVDGLRRTVTLVHIDGTRVDATADAVRGTGVGGGSYIFQPLPSGESRIESDGGFAFDVIWHDEEGEPPWSRS